MDLLALLWVCAAWRGGRVTRRTKKMLLDLRAEKYTVIQRAGVEFGPGLNLLTGETGAGKSILIDALVLLLGGKASTDVIRHGEERAALSCSFEATAGAMAVLDENGVTADEDTLLIRREITAAGKGRVFVNDQPATVGLLRQLAPHLALVHAQSETTASFDEAEQRDLLDRFARMDLGEVGKVYGALRETTARLRELEDASSERLRAADLWRFQSEEIADANLVGPDEDQRLEAEKRLLVNAERLSVAAGSAYEALYEDEHSAEVTLGAALKQLEELARFDPRFAEAVQQIAAAKSVVEDVADTVRRSREAGESSPERLSEIEDRLVVLDRLKRKYGSTLAAVLAHADEVQARLNEVEHRDEHLQRLTAEREQLVSRFRKLAGAASAKRGVAAGRLGSAAQKECNELAMRVRFSVEVTAAPEDERLWSSKGWDSVQMTVATNAGEPLKPLTEVASGGEMSRILLALKVSVEREARADAAVHAERTLIFDEIDVGIGGGAAEAVGAKLKQLSRGQQVVCITHLPQIAAFADRHYLISKTERAGRTETVVRLLDEEERRQEIARMLSGAQLTETSLRHAEQLMKISR